MSQSHHFEDALCREDGHEDQVDFVKDVHFLLTLVVGFHHHGDHVQADKEHDADVEGLFRDHIKNEALILVLEGIGDTE